MKKVMQCLVAALSALVWPVLFVATAFAATTPPLPPKEGSLTIHKYALEGSAQPGLPGDGTSAAEIPQGALPLANIEFTVWRVQADEETMPETAVEARQYIEEASAVQMVTGVKGTATVTLERGVYYVEETAGQTSTVGSAQQSYVPCAPFLVSVPMTDPSGTGWITDVHVYPKNQALTIDKFVNEPGDADYDFGNINAAKYKPVQMDKDFGWTIVSSLPRELGTLGPKAEKYTVTDELTDVFTYMPGTVRVYSAPAGNTARAAANPLREGEDYTTTFNTQTNTLTMQLTPQGAQLLQARYSNTTANDRVLIIKYNCQLNGRAKHGVDYPSGATVTYTKAAAGTTLPAPALRATTLMGAPSPATQTVTTSTVLWQPAVHTGQVGITKVNAENPTQTLAGAEFGIAFTKEEAKAGTFIATGTTGEDGRLVFTGLAYGQPGDQCHQNTCGTSFWLVEISPPEGYAPVADAVEITFKHQQDGNAEEIYFSQVTVHNKPAVGSNPVTPGGKPAPQTGDSIMLAAALGMLLISGMAIVVLGVLKKKKQ